MECSSWHNYSCSWQNYLENDMQLKVSKLCLTLKFFSTKSLCLNLALKTTKKLSNIFIPPPVLKLWDFVFKIFLFDFSVPSVEINSLNFGVTLQKDFDRRIPMKKQTQIMEVTSTFVFVFIIFSIASPQLSNWDEAETNCRFVYEMSGSECWTGLWLVEILA